jgi:hypothetical protein
MNLCAAGINPADYCALPVTLDLALDQKAHVARVPTGDPEQPYQDVLVVTFRLGLAANLMNMPRTRLVLPDSAKAANPMQNVTPRIEAHWVVPRANLSDEGRRLLVAWDLAGESNCYRDGFGAVTRTNPNPTEPDGGWEGYAEGEVSDWRRGSAAAQSLVESSGWDELEVTRLSRLVQQSGEVSDGPISASANGRVFGVCPSCNQSRAERYCSGTPSAPHPMKRVRSGPPVQ